MQSTTSRTAGFARELGPMVRLAGPVVLGEVGWMLMGIVDTMMVGRVSAEAIGGVSIGGVLFSTVMVFGAGLLLGLDTLVSQAFGAGRLGDCHRALVNGVYLSLALAPAATGLLWIAAPGLGVLEIQPGVVREAVPYLRAISWGCLPQLLFFALRRYAQGMNLVRPVMWVLLTANLINAGVNWVLIFGNWGAPALGTEGAGWATTVSRLYMAGVLAAYLWHRDRRAKTGLRQTPFAPEAARLRQLVALGLPAGLQATAEVGVFATATALIGRLEPVALAAHQVAMNLATLTYMVALGVSSAAAVRVGQALGRQDPDAAGRAGWTAMALGAGFMACAGLAFVSIPERILALFTVDPSVIRTGAALLAVAAAFQLFDGIQTVATGALRGAADTRTPMICHLVGYWAVGLPVGVFLCFRLGWGAAGLWAGLCIALILIAVVLLGAWRRAVQRLSNSRHLQQP